MTISEVLGVLGFILALLHVFWQVWWQHSQNKERVRAVVSLGSKPCVRVHNTGLVPVYLAGVELVVNKDGTTKKFPFQAVVVQQCLPKEAGSLGEEVWQFVGRQTYNEPLPRGGKYIFALPKALAPMNELVANADRAKMWVSVYSNGGEVYRLKKKHALAYLAELVGPG